MTSIKKPLRVARVLHVALLVMVVVDFDISYRFAPIQNQISPILVYAIAFVGLNEIGVAAKSNDKTLGRIAVFKSQ